MKKRSIILRSLLIVATPYTQCRMHILSYTHTTHKNTHTHTTHKNTYTDNIHRHIHRQHPRTSVFGCCLCMYFHQKIHTQTTSKDKRLGCVYNIHPLTPNLCLHTTHKNTLTHIYTLSYTHTSTQKHIHRQQPKTLTHTH